MQAFQTQNPKEGNLGEQWWEKKIISPHPFCCLCLKGNQDFYELIFYLIFEQAAGFYISTQQSTSGMMVVTTIPDLSYFTGISRHYFLQIQLLCRFYDA